MTIETSCYVCGAKMPCIDGLCPDCTMNEFWDSGAAFATTFGTLNSTEKPQSIEQTAAETDTVEHSGETPQ